jgi:phage terminase small subunit
VSGKNGLSARELGLNPRQMKFVYAYMRTGVGKTAAIEAGYSKSNAEFQAVDLLRRPNVTQAIRLLSAEALTRDVADVAELREWWTRVLRGDELDGENAPAMKDRLKASDLLGKSQGAFLERVDLTNSDGSLAPTIDVSKLSTATLKELMRAARDAQ